MRIISSGSLSIVNIDDFKQLVSYIGSSESKTVIYDPNTDTYIPDYTVNNQVLTPQLYIAGSNTDVIDRAKSIRWYAQVDSTGDPIEITSDDSPEYVIGSNGALIISMREVEYVMSMTYICEIVYEDADTGAEIPIKSDIQIIKVVNGQKGEDGESGELGAISTVVMPNGNTIKNSEGVLNMKVITYKGSETINPYLFKWYKLDPSATVDSGGDEDGGNGWRLINDNFNQGITGYNTDTITIPSEAISGLSSFKSIVRVIGGRNQITKKDFTSDNERQTITDTGELSNYGTIIYEGVKNQSGTPPISLGTINKEGKYTASIFYKSEELNEQQARVIFYDSTNRVYLAETFADNHTDWQRIVVSADIEDIDDRIIYVYFYLPRDEGEKGYFHSPQLESGSRVTPYIPDYTLQDIGTVIDVSDPVSIMISGSGVFKNSQGQSQFLARAYRNGEEIDLDGDKYTYAWSLYKEDGTALISFGVKYGKSITVNSSDFIERANLICEVTEE